MNHFGIQNIYFFPMIPDFGMVKDTTFFQSKAVKGCFRRVGKVLIKLDPTHYAKVYEAAGITPEGGGTEEPEVPVTPPEGGGEGGTDDGGGTPTP